MVGAVLGNYRLISQISSGGMGTVYRAQHEILGRPAAVKLLRAELTANEELVERFLIEAKAATKIRHPGIVEVFDFGYADAGFAYLVMELLEGKPLGKALADVERFSEWEAASIARGIASALKAAHAQGIIHRDLKPDNVFLVPDLEGVTGSMRPKVLDFGIAKLSADHKSHHTQTGVLMGTPHYMAPEQAREASAIDHRADLYSLGCMLYELLSGTPPFVSEGAGEIVALHLFAEPEPLSSRIRDISPEMNALVMRLLAKDPQQRFQTAQEVTSALTALVGGRLSNELASMSSGVRPALPPATLRNSHGVASTIPSSGPKLVGRFEPDAPTVALPATVPQQRRSAIPIIAGVATLVIAAVVVFAIVRFGGSNKSGGSGGSNDSKPPPPAPTRIEVKAKAPPPPPQPEPPVVTPSPSDEKPLPKSNPTRTPSAAPAQAPRPPNRRPVTPDGSPMETDLGPDKKKKDLK